MKRFPKGYITLRTATFAKVNAAQELHPAVLISTLLDAILVLRYLLYI